MLLFGINLDTLNATDIILRVHYEPGTSTGTQIKLFVSLRLTLVILENFKVITH